MSDVETRKPGHYLTIKIDRVCKRHNPMRNFREAEFTLETETVIEADNQFFSPSLMASVLRALADEIDPANRAEVPQ